MDSINSFKGYGKVDPAEEAAFRRRSRRRMVILITSAIVLITVVTGAVAGTLIHNKNSDSSGNNAVSSPASPAASLRAVCSQTLYPDTCYSSIASMEASNTTDPEEIFRLSLKVAIKEVSKLHSLPDQLIAKTNDTRVKAAIEDCRTLFEDVVDYLNDSISTMDVGKGETLLSVSKINDIKTWLSTTITDQETCLDGLEESNSTLVDQVKLAIKNSTEFSSNSLAIVGKILSLLADFDLSIHRKLLEFPEWVSPADRRLLQESNPAADIIVAQDSSGHFKTIEEAVKLIAKKNTTRTVIYIKAGKYLENIILDKSLWNVMMYGDGNSKTIISGSLNFIDGTPTFSTATFAVAGQGFIARDIKFENTAGAAKHQAVALRSGSDRSVFYKCSFDAFQDTLYAHSNRQFYRECDITGTIDFIFGNAAVVFQNCNIFPRQPLANQFVTITAQGKKDPGQNTGISIHNCVISPLDDLTAKTYLGRPWKEYSTTVIMQTNIGSFLNPQGWIEWVSGVDPPNTIFYAEYANTGLGSNVNSRVKWDGYRSNITTDVAAMYTVGSFILGNEWLAQTGVTFQLTL